MAEIFLATQLGREGFQKPVILKRIHSTIYADPQFRNMFIDEAHISMSLAHSNIAQVLDLGVAQGRYFLVLELVDGWDLGRVLQRAAAANTPLPRELGLYITADVCRALAYAHGKSDGQTPLGIVHRDVSPHNILLSEQGEIKLTDFGIAKAMNKREQTGTGVVKGKVAFMSPEQAYGKPIDQRSDLFSLGTVLYLLMVRSRPFEAPTDLETLLRVQKGDFTPPEAAAPDLEPEVAAIINRALKHDVNERYQSADEMLADIEHVLRNVYRPVGQTELKRWLAELSAHDGTLSILKGGARHTSSRPGTGSGELDGKDVVLSDSQEIEEDDEIDTEARTSLAVVEANGGGRMRMSRARSTHAPTPLSLPVPRDAESELDGRASQELGVLPIPETDEPPDRRRKRAGGGWLKLLFAAGVVLVAAWYGGQNWRAWFGGAEGDQTTGAKATAKTTTTASARPTPAPVEAKPAVEKPKAEPAPKPTAAAEPAGAQARKQDGKEDGKQDGKEDGKQEAKPEKPVREPPAHKKAVERVGAKERERVHSIDLKSMMAPDPSQLPPPEAAPKPAPPPPPPPPAPENP